MINEKDFIETTLLELANRVWLYTLSSLRDDHRLYKTKDPEDPRVVHIEAKLEAYQEILGKMLDKLGNSDYSLLVNSLRLEPKD